MLASGLVAWAIIVASVKPLSAQEKSTIDYGRDIKPILSDRCYQCHGPDEGQRKADLRLDDPESALDTAIEPGNPDGSSLLERIQSDDPDEVMPPPDSNRKPLTESEVEKLRAWIEQGAKFEAHWAYQKPVRPPLPDLTGLKDWAQSPIDKFIAAKLEANGKRPSGPADRRTLIRRLYFDLIGLPPSPDEVERFIRDESVDAVEKVIDELLANEAFGERMAVYWLDQVRYADTNGIHGDNHRDHSLYRDYVIAAFNSNMPFDRFTVEQLAGDLLPNRTNRQWIASGYNRLNMTTREGGAQPKEYRAKYAADRVRNVSVVWMGSTMGCSECHDHKYDPFKMKDFYSLAAYFADIDEVAVGAQPPIRLPTDRQLEQLQDISRQIETAKRELYKGKEQRQDAFKSFIEQQTAAIKNAKPTWSPAAPREAKSSGGATLKIENRIIKSTGSNPAKDNYRVVFKPELSTVTGFRLEVLTDPEFPNKSVGRGNGNIVLTDVRVTIGKQPAKIKSAVADFSQDGFGIGLAIDSKPETGWAVSGHTRAENRIAVFVFDKPIRVAQQDEVVIELRHESVYPKHNIGKFRVSFTDAQSPNLDDRQGVPADIVALLKKPAEKRTEAETEQLYRYFVDTAKVTAAMREKIQLLQQKKKAIENSFRPILVTKSVKPRMTRVLPRGNWLDDSGPEVQPAVPSFLISNLSGNSNSKTESDRRANRLDLARWIVDRNNPLTARVFVNRLWKIAFGEGIVRTPDDFGSQGAVPTHPELLDYLAIEFMESGWDVKKMLKSIVMSRTYQQSSAADADALKSDPANLLLSRQNRFRLDAEFVRDNALSISGLLTRDVGGDSVKPYQPAGYWRHLNFPRRTYQPNTDRNQYRRGLYTYWCRTFLHPSLAVFDAPSREESCVQRPRSNTPLQALVLLNDPTYVEAAVAFGEKIMRGASDDPGRIRLAFVDALNRKPEPREVEILLGVLNDHRKDYAADPQAAQAAIQVGIHKPPKDLAPAELAAWTSIARIVLNLNETITRY